MSNSQLYISSIAILNGLISSVENQTVFKTPSDLTQPIVKQIEYLIWCLDNSDESLFSDVELAAINTHTQTIQSHIASAPNSPEGYARNIRATLRELMISVQGPRRRKISRQESKALIEEVSLEIGALQERINQETKKIEKASSEVNSSLVDSWSAAEEIQRKLSETNSQIETKLSTFDGSVKSSIAAALANAEARLSTSIDDFTKKSSEQTAQFQVAQKQFESDAKSQIDNAVAQAAISMGEYETSAKIQLENINKISGVAGSNATAGDLILSANEERTSYRWIAFASAALLTVGSYFAYKVVEPALTGTVNLETAIARIAIMFSIFLPAAFVAGLANKHRRAEIGFRSLALRIAAFEPYLANLSIEQRAEMRVKMSDVFFNGHISDEKTKNTEFDLSKITEKNFTVLVDGFEKLRNLFAK